MSTSINFQVERERHSWAKITFTLTDDHGKAVSKAVIVRSDQIAATMDSIMTKVDPSKDIAELAANIANGITNQGVGRSGFTLKLSSETNEQKVN